MRHVVIVAARGGPDAKSRCSSVLDAAQRDQLAQYMFEDVAASLSVSSEFETRLTTPTPSLAAIAERFGFQSYLEPTPLGLNEAFEHARRAAPDAVTTLLPGDIPSVEPADIRTMYELCANNKIVVVRAHDGGTLAITLAPSSAIPLQFGLDSAHLHLSAARALGYQVSEPSLPSLQRDIDEPRDLEWLAAEGHGKAAAFLRATLRR